MRYNLSVDFDLSLMMNVGVAGISVGELPLVSIYYRLFEYYKLSRSELLSELLCPSLTDGLVVYATLTDLYALDTRSKTSVKFKSFKPR